MAELDLVLETLKSSFPRRHRPRLPRLGCLKSSASDGDALYARQCPRVADGITYGEAIAAALMKEVNALRATQKVGGGVRPSIGVSGLRALLEQYSKSIPFEDPDAFATFDVDAWLVEGEERERGGEAKENDSGNSPARPRARGQPPLGGAPDGCASGGSSSCH